MKRVRVIVETEDGERLASYSGIPMSVAENVLSWLGIVVGAFATAAGLKRQIEGTPKRRINRR